MPSQSSDGARLQAVAEALTPLREVSAEGADEALALYVDLGDAATQRALDECLEQVADVLRALDGEAQEQATRLQLAARRLGAGDRAGSGLPADTSTRADTDPAATRTTGAGWPARGEQ